MDLTYIWDEVDRFDKGMALHYPFLYAAVVGLEAKQVVEFGAGVSTRVILDALATTGGALASFSTDTEVDIVTRYLPGRRRATSWLLWTHFPGLTSTQHTKTLPFVIDLVLHDGAHDAETVAADLRWIEPYVRQYGLILVHDTLHSVCGPAVRQGIENGLRDAYSEVTLPYGFGLTILRKESTAMTWRADDPKRYAAHVLPLQVTRQKLGSTATTVIE